MVELFDNKESAYLAWVHANPNGFVANIDRAGKFLHYPMVHAATHGLLSSVKIGNFTTGDYVKFCSTNLDALEQYSRTTFGRSLTRCLQCM